MQSVSISIRGSKRVVNQDSIFVDDTKGVYLVCDGMGGHKAGDIASRMAIKIISEITISDRSAEGIERACDQANKAILEKSVESPEYKGMGTTMVGCFVEGDSVKIAHIGDSRAYRLKDGRLKLLTKDHSIVEKLLESGQINQKEAETHHMRNVIYKAIGMEDGICFDRDKDLDEFEIEQGEVFLLCSDGLSGAVNIDDTNKVLIDEEFCNIPKVLSEMAIKNGSTDDITIIIIKI